MTPIIIGAVIIVIGVAAVFALASVTNEAREHVKKLAEKNAALESILRDREILIANGQACREACRSLAVAMIQHADGKLAERYTACARAGFDVLGLQEVSIRIELQGIAVVHRGDHSEAAPKAPKS
jgi:hypothetical protein